MKVRFVLRADAKFKPGGDTSKAERFTHQLTALGHDVKVCYNATNVDQCDIVHLINSDLPIENGRLASDLAGKSKFLVVTSIHHPFAGIENFYRHGQDRLCRALGSVGVGWERGISIREGLKLVTRGQVASSVTALRPTSELQRKLLSRADLVLPLNESEYKTLTADLAMEVNAHIVPNGMTFAAHTDSWSAAHEHPWNIVSVGRVEPRKNSLALARAARDMGARALFVGAPNRNHRAYFKEFLTTVGQSSELAYLTAVPNKLIAPILLQADFYVNAAWFEVVSQADVEAASLGVPIVSTKHSYSRDAIGDYSSIDPALLASPTSGVEALRQAVAKAKPASIPRVTSWADSTIELLEAYESLWQ